ncbi:uncharacterized protein [Palaemon carinicauda]|uniref:uncharacterized protein n=1 Tax=Palaemon carinicauda TaxID=392227 RepID=UPI0035B5B866
MPRYSRATLEDTDATGVKNEGPVGYSDVDRECKREKRGQVLENRKGETINLSKVTTVPERRELLPAQTLTRISVTSNQPLLEETKVVVKPHDKWAHVVLEGLSEIKENRADIRVINLSKKLVVLRNYSLCELEYWETANNGILTAKTPARTYERTQNLIIQVQKLCLKGYQRVVSNIVNNYFDVIAMGHKRPERIDQFPFSFETGQAKPISSRPYKVPIHFQGKMEREISKLKKLGIIKESEYPCASPIVAVMKKDGLIRLER